MIAPRVFSQPIWSRQGKIALLELDLIAVKGKTVPETIYALLVSEDLASDVRFQELRKPYSTMLYCYRSRDWEGALEAVELCRASESHLRIGWGSLSQRRNRILRLRAPADQKYRSGTLITSPGKIGTDADIGYSCMLVSPSRWTSTVVRLAR
jgi:hypothetical protein